MKSLLRIFALLAATAVMVVALAAPAQAAPSRYATGKGCTANTYRQGSSGTCVAYIQAMLNGIRSGYGVGSTLVVDGDFGSLTAKQTRSYQKWNHLVADGVVGPKTWNELCFYTGQVAFSYTSSTKAKQTAWKAAYSAGCWVEYQKGSKLYWKKRY